MGIPIRRGSLALALSCACLFIVGVSACNGGSEDEVIAIPTSTRTADASTATARPTPAPTATSSGPGTGAIPLDRFHYSATLRMSPASDDTRQLYVSTDGDFAKPDRHSFTYATELGEGELRERVVVIGNDAWYARQEEPWRAMTVDDEPVAGLLETAYSSLRPQFLGGPEFERVRASVLGLPSTQEFINAVRSDHYRVDEAGLAFMAAFLAGDSELANIEDLAWDIWLEATDAWPVRLLMTGTLVEQVEILHSLGLTPPAAWELRVDVSRPNDPDIVIQSPLVE